MGAGGWVFPIAILVFLGYFTSFLAGHPAIATQGTIVRAGDHVEAEATQYFGDGYVSFTSREDLYSSGALRASPFGIAFDPRPLQLDIPSGPDAARDPVLGAIIGHRINQTFQTEKLPDFYGTWTGTRIVNPELARLPVRASVRDGDPAAGGPFNFTRFVDRWSQALRHPLTAGDVIGCESGLPWSCHVDRVDAAARRIDYTRTVETGMEIPPATLLVFAPNTPTPRTNATMVLLGGEFSIRWAPAAGEAFTVAQKLGDWTPAAYRVDEVAADGVHVHEKTDYQRPGGGVVPAHLIGVPVWFEFTVVKIERA